MKTLSSTNIQLLLEHINDYLNLGIKDCKKFRVINGKVEISLSDIHLATAEASEKLHLQHVFPGGKSLGAIIQNNVILIPILQLIKLAKETYHFSNDNRRENELKKMFSYFPSLKEICLYKISDYLEDSIISADEVLILSNFEFDQALMNLGLFKNNSPVVRIPNKEFSNENNLVDKTPIDPYHPGAIVPYSKF